MRISDWSSDVCSSDLGVQLPARQAISLGRFDFAMVHAADRPGEDFRGVGAGVQGEGQDRAVHRIAKETVEQGLGAHRFEAVDAGVADQRSEEHTSELQSLMRISYAVFCLKKKKRNHTI